jgi:SNF2 family DNA or RNA helicase
VPPAPLSAATEPLIEPATTIPNLKTPAWRHQVLAYDFLRERGDALLAMGMGTGKSLVAIGAACSLDVDLALIACPLRVVDVWPEQFRRHAGIPIRVLSLGSDAGSVAYKTGLAMDALKLTRLRRERLVIVINYESMWREPFASWALHQAWGLAIYDESHKIKKPSGKASAFCARLRERVRHRLALTGTPMPHSPLDIYAQARALSTRYFGRSYYAFKQTYAVMGGFQARQVIAYNHLEQLEAIMRQFTFRVGKEVLDLPSETNETCYCYLDREGMRVYRGLEQEFVAEVKAGTITAANAMVKLVRLQQVTGGTVRTDSGAEIQVDGSKRALLLDTLEDIGPEEPVVVFCRYHSDLEAAHSVAAALGSSSLELSGRRDELKRWQAGEAQVLAVQIQAGGVGVDLTRARYGIYYSLSFSLGEYEQSKSREHRPGQTRPVTHIHLVARGTVDEKIMRALDTRAEVIESILKEIKAQ